MGMSAHWPYLLLLVPAVPLAYEDFRMRQVSVVWLALLGVGCFGTAWLASGFVAALSCTAANGCVLAVLAAVMTLYQLLRRRPLRAFFTHYFGSGDAVMLAAVVPLFSPAGYVRFLLVCCLAALGWWAVRRPATIPLAGFMALTFGVFALCKTAGLWS